MPTRNINTDLKINGSIELDGILYDAGASAGTSGQVLSSTSTGTDWVTLSEISGVDGTGTANYLSKWLDANTITNSLVYDNGTNVGIGTAIPSYKLDVNGSINSTSLNVNGINQHSSIRYTLPSQSVSFARTAASNSSTQWFKIYSGGGSTTLIRLSIQSGGDNTQSRDEFLISVAGYGFNHHIQRLPAGKYNTSKLLAIATTNPSGGTVEIWVKLVGMVSGSASTNIFANAGLESSSNILSSATGTAPTITSNGTQLDISTTNRNETTIMASRGATFGGNVGIGTDSPSTKLEVAGTITATGGTFTGALNTGSNAFGGTYLGINSNGITQWGANRGILTWGTGYAHIYGGTGSELRIGGGGSNDISIILDGSSVAINKPITTSGNVTMGSSGTPKDLLIHGNSAGENLQYDGSASLLKMYHKSDAAGLEMYVGGGAQPTTHQAKIGRSNSQYLGIRVDDSSAYIVHRQDETDATVAYTRNEIWSSSTGEKAWRWYVADNAGASASEKMELNSSSELTLQGGTNTITNAKVGLWDASYAGGPYLPLSGGIVTGTTTIDNLLILERSETSYGAALRFSEAGTKNWELKQDQDGGNGDRLLLANASNSPVITFEQAGNVGIGIARPSAKLEVIGTIKVGNSGTSRLTDTSAYPLQLNRGLAVDSVGAAGVILGLGSYSTGTTYVDAVRVVGVLGANGTDGDLQLQVLNSGSYVSALTLNNDNNATFAGDITVSGNQNFNGTYIKGDSKTMFSYSDSWLRINQSNDFTAGIYCGTGILRTDGAFQVGSGGSEFLVTAAGNVGIGATSPTAPLDVLGVRAGRDWSIANRATIRLDANGTGFPSDILFGHTAAANQTSWTGAYWALSSRGSGAGDKFYFYRASGNASNPSEAVIMTFDPDLNVGIGTVSPSTALDVVGVITADGGTSTEWNTSYDNSIISLAVGGTTTKTLTATQQDGGTLTASWTDDNAGGTVTGTGAVNQVAFWNGTNTIDGTSNLYWDSTNNHLGINDNTPSSPLKVASGTTETSIYTVNISHARNNANIATQAVRIDMDLSGADTTTADRTNYGLYLDIDSSANGDSANEHRIHGVNSDLRFSGFTDVARAGYFYAESNYTGAKTAQLIGVHGNAIHDTNSTSGGVSNMYGVYGSSSIQDLGDVDNAFGGYFAVTITTSRGAADVGVTKGVEAEIAIDKDVTINYGTMMGVSSIIDNNEGTVPNFGTQYLFKGDYQGTRGANAYGIYSEGDKHYFEGNVGIGTTSPTKRLDVRNNVAGDYAYFGGSTDGGQRGLVLSSADNGIYLGAIHDIDATSGSGILTLSTAGAERMRINSSGNVSIGTASVAAANAAADDLHLKSSGSNGITISSGNAQTGTIFFGDAASSAAAGFRYNHNTGDMAISAEDNITFACDNVGIGVAGPTHALSVNGSARFYSGYLNQANKAEKLLAQSFPNGVANQAFDIELANKSFWGSIVVSITGTYSNQNISGTLTKQFSVGYNPNGVFYTNESRVKEAQGAVIDNVTIGDIAYNSTKSKFVIPIYHIVSTGNPCTVKIEAFSHGGSTTSGAYALFDGVLLSSSYTTTIPAAFSTKQYPFYTSRLGIGTVSPASVLHVSGGSVTIPTLSTSHPFTISNSTNSGMSIISGTSNAGQVVFGDGSDADVGRLRYDHSDNSMRFWTNADEKMRITSSGNVGIGTPSPSDRLHVKNNDASASNTRCDIRLENGLGYAEFGVLSGYARIQANGVEAAALSGGTSLFYGTQWLFGSNLTTGNEDGKLTINGGSGTSGEAYLNLSRNGVSGFILNHTATAIQVRASANIPMSFHTNSIIGIQLNANSTVSFPEYGAGTLVTDASGNITASSGGGAGGPYLPLAGGILSGTLDITGTLNDRNYQHGGSAYWKTKKYIRAVGGSGADIGGKWVHLTRVVIDSGYEKARIKFTINSYDDVASGVEAIDVSYENGSSAQEHHQLAWYSTDDNATIFSEVRSIRSSSSGLSNTYDLYVQMAGDWRDSFTVSAESWVTHGSSTPITFETSAGSSTAPTAGSDDKAATSRRWFTANSQMYLGNSRIFADDYHPNADTLTTARTINGVSFNGSANITVADSTKLPLAGGTLTGDLVISTSAFTNLDLKTSRTAATDNIGGLQFFKSSTLKGQIFGVNDGKVKIATGGSTVAMTLDENQNVGIGITTPAAKLHVNGEAQFGLTSYQGDMNGGKADLSVDCGGTPEISFIGNYLQAGSTDQNWAMKLYTGTLQTYSQDLYVVAGGTGTTSKLLLGTNGQTSTITCNNGNVGIGNTNPAAALDIYGAIKLNSNGTVGWGTGSNSGFLTWDNSGYSRAIVKGQSGYALHLGSNNNNERLVIDTNGNVGIGITSPSYPLHVLFSGDTGARIESTDNHSSLFIDSHSSKGQYIRFTENDANQYWIQSFGGKLNFRPAGTGTAANRVTFDATGNVGIGTISPAEKLEVVGQAIIDGGVGVNSSGTLHLRQKGNTSGDGLAITSAHGTSHRIWKDVNGKLNIGPSNFPSSFVQDTAGNVGIGTTSPASELHIEASDDPNLLITRGGVNKVLLGDSGTNNGGDLLLYDANGTLKTLLRSGASSYLNGGNVGIGTTGPQQKLHVYKSNAPAGIEIQGGLTAITAIGDVHSFIDFGTNDGSATGGIAGRIESLAEAANGAYNGLAFYTGRQSRTPYLQKAMQIRNTGAISFGSGSATYGLSGQLLQSNGDASPTWASDITVGDIIASGNVGVGVTIPSAKLDVVGQDVNMYSGTGYQKVRIGRNSTERFELYVNDTTNQITAYQDSDSNGAHNFILDRSFLGTGASNFSIANNGTSHLLIDKNGSVGIGATSPDTLLNLKGVKNTSIITLESTTNNTDWSVGDKIGGINFHSADASGGGAGIKASISYQVSLGNTGATNAMVFSAASGGTNNIERMRIDVNGNVGIGETSPTAKLHVYDDRDISSYSEDKGIRLVESAGDWLLSLGISGVSNTAFAIRNNALSTYPFVIRETTGYIGIGTHNPSSKLQVIGTITATTVNATTKNFLIDNPKTGGELRYSVVESNEYGVCVRGESDQEEIELPEEWEWLVHEDSVTVQLTSIDQVQHLFVLERNNIKVRVGGLATNGQYSYVVYGTRKDVDPLEVNI